MFVHEQIIVLRSTINLSGLWRNEWSFANVNFESPLTERKIWIVPGIYIYEGQKTQIAEWMGMRDEKPRFFFFYYKDNYLFHFSKGEVHHFCTTSINKRV